MKMKKIFGVLALTILLTGCGVSASSVEEVPQDTGNRFNGVNQDIEIITDSETGCKYIYIDSGFNYSNTVSITPLMKNDELVDCGK